MGTKGALNPPYKNKSSLARRKHSVGVQMATRKTHYNPPPTYLRFHGNKGAGMLKSNISDPPFLPIHKSWLADPAKIGKFR